jgi:hypothetical protein
MESSGRKMPLVESNPSLEDEDVPPSGARALPLAGEPSPANDVAPSTVSPEQLRAEPR